MNYGKENENAAANKVKAAEKQAYQAGRRVEQEKQRAAKREQLARAQQKQNEQPQSVEQAREEREQLKKIKHSLAEERKKDKAERKRLIREQRKTMQREKKAKKQASKGYGGWLAAVISLGVVTLALSSYLLVDYMRGAPAKRMMSGVYQRSYYDFIKYVDNLDVNMSKLTVAEGRSEQIALLTDVHAQALLAVSDAEQLPLEDESKFGTVKFINQLGDYAKSLQTKLARGEALSAEDNRRIEEMYAITRSIKASLAEVNSKMGEDYNFFKFGKNGKSDSVRQGFTKLENDAVEYPAMIYDGPFSDGLKNVGVKGLSGEEITAAKAEEVFRATFADYKMASVSVLGEANGNIAAYNVEAKLEDGTTVFAQISRVGGKLLLFELYDECTEQNLDRQQCIDVALGFLAGQGITEVKPVWINLADATATINFAYVQNGVICYSDLIKMDVCTQKGRVTGMEAVSYYTNHRERAIPKVAVRCDVAKTKVSKKLNQQTCRLAYIPMGNEDERLAYEISGTADGNTYYVYVDALTMEQIKTFRVVKTTEGDLLE